MLRDNSDYGPEHKDKLSTELDKMADESRILESHDTLVSASRTPSEAPRTFLAFGRRYPGNSVEASDEEREERNGSDADVPATEVEEKNGAADPPGPGSNPVS